MLLITASLYLTYSADLSQDALKSFLLSVCAKLSKRILKSASLKAQDKEQNEKVSFAKIDGLVDNTQRTMHNVFLSPLGLVEKNLLEQLNHLNPLITVCTPGLEVGVHLT